MNRKDWRRGHKRDAPKLNADDIVQEVMARFEPLYNRGQNLIRRDTGNPYILVRVEAKEDNSGFNYYIQRADPFVGLDFQAVTEAQLLLEYRAVSDYRAEMFEA